jgi:hypothetical protein
MHFVAANYPGLLSDSDSGAVPATIIRKALVGDELIKLRLEVSNEFNYIAGKGIIDFKYPSNYWFISRFCLNSLRTPTVIPGQWVDFFPPGISKIGGFSITSAQVLSLNVYSGNLIY